MSGLDIALIIIGCALAVVLLVGGLLYMKKKR